MKITKNKNPNQSFTGKVTNDAEGYQFVKNMRKLGLTVRVRGRHSDRKSLVNKMGKTHNQIRDQGSVPLRFAEYLSLTVISR